MPEPEVKDIHMYETNGTANCRTGRHITVLYERLPSQVKSISSGAVMSAELQGTCRAGMQKIMSTPFIGSAQPSLLGSGAVIPRRHRSLPGSAISTL
ncbi:hypothetical protein J6590_085237 [Homalodisca vitripennis]|nr:hypothetical protein J6590_085237 [Homalodisca vitripennis]